MTYGDGDGQTFIPLCLAIDVVAHELTRKLHGLAPEAQRHRHSHHSHRQISFQQMV